jgi:CheY-like chemotaxis protein
MAFGFTPRLGAGASRPPKARSAAVNPLPSGVTMSAPLLFVDDSPLARAATTRVLGQQGVRVTALGSAAEALTVDAATFGAALLDLELGDGLGTDVAARLRLAAPALPIAFLTGGAPPPALAEARRFGPVFSKVRELDEAVAWVLAALR